MDCPGLEEWYDVRVSCMNISVELSSVLSRTYRTSTARTQSKSDTVIAEDMPTRQLHRLVKVTSTNNTYLFRRCTTRPQDPVHGSFVHLRPTQQSRHPYAYQQHHPHDSRDNGHLQHSYYRNDGRKAAIQPRKVAFRLEYSVKQHDRDAEEKRPHRGFEQTF